VEQKFEALDLDEPDVFLEEGELEDQIMIKILHVCDNLT